MFSALFSVSPSHIRTHVQDAECDTESRNQLELTAINNSNP